MVVLNKEDLPDGAFIKLNEFYPKADWVCGWVDSVAESADSVYETCYCVFFYDRDLYCVRLFPIGFGTPNSHWSHSVDNTINNCRR